MTGVVDFEAHAVYNLMVTASDHGEPPLSTDALVVVEVGWVLSGGLKGEVRGGGWRGKLEGEVGGGGWRGRLEKEVGRGGWRGRLEGEVGGGGWRGRLEGEVRGGG